MNNWELERSILDVFGSAKGANKLPEPLTIGAPKNPLTWISDVGSVPLNTPATVDNAEISNDNASAATLDILLKYSNDEPD